MKFTELLIIANLRYLLENKQIAKFGTFHGYKRNIMAKCMLRFLVNYNIM